MSRSIVVTASNSSYLGLTNGLLASLREYAPDVPVGLLDVGLGAVDRAALEAVGVRVVTPEWHAPSAFLNAYQPQGWYRAMTARPYLPQYFPDFDTIVWIDGDAWVAGGDAVSVLAAAAQRRNIAVTSSSDRNYERHHGAHILEARLAMAQVLETCMPKSAAQTLAIGSEYCSGVFAMRRSSPVWDLWAAELGRVIEYILANRSTLYHVFEQAALNLTLYGIPLDQLALLPSRYNWIVGQAMPLVDLDGRCLREPQPPHDPIKLVHLIHNGRGTDKLVEVELRTTDGRRLRSSLDYAAVAALMIGETRT